MSPFEAENSGVLQRTTWMMLAKGSKDAVQ